ncbi:MAG: AraC family transcriptional regulator [Cyclobacteriaceae bacterium]
MDIRIANTLDHIEINLHQQLTLEELAEVACLSPSQFHRKFKNETKRTPFIFIEEMKMAKAYELISEGKGTVHDLAFSLGYRDYETFSRAFKKHFFLSPDDLKSIAKKVKSLLEDEELLLITVESNDENEIRKKLQKVMDEKGLPIELLNFAKAIKISEKTEATPPERLIKNKFEVSQGQKLWQSIISSEK